MRTLMTLSVSIFVAIGITAGPSHFASAATPPPPPPSGCFWNPASNSVICAGSSGSGASGSLGGTTGTSGSAPGGQPPQTYIQIGYLEAAAATHPVCWVWAEDDVTGDSQELIGEIEQFWSVVEQVFPPCPGVVATTALQWALEYWTAFFYTKQLPSPHPRVPPGYAITGLPAYLVCGDADIVTVQRPTPLGELTITAQATYDVSWGDGTTSDGLSGPCTPWPDGAVDHTYDDTGTYNVDVEQVWHVTWALGSDSGSFGDVTTTGAIEDLGVRQVQGVVTG